jgi:hypothetical protein
MVLNDDEVFLPAFACEESERVVESAEGFAVGRGTISFANAGGFICTSFYV